MSPVIRIAMRIQVFKRNFYHSGIEAFTQVSEAVVCRGSDTPTVYMGIFICISA